MSKFDKQVEAHMVNHMNKDHVDAMRDYCKFNNVIITNEDPKMLAIDQDGFDMLVNGETLRISFKYKCITPQQVREVLVEMAKEARTDVLD
jgi:putative heme iron utilization protein